MPKPLKLNGKKLKLLTEKIKKADASKSLTLEEVVNISNEWKEKHDNHILHQKT